VNDEDNEGELSDLDYDEQVTINQNKMPELNCNQMNLKNINPDGIQTVFLSFQTKHI